MFCDKGADWLRDQITDGLTGGNSRADLRGRDVDPPTERGEGVRAVIFTPAEDDELDERAQIVDAAPGVELRHIVVADEVVQFGLGMAGAHLLHGVDGEARPFTMDFLIVHDEAWFILHGRAEHLVTQRRRDWLGVQLVWGKRCGDENHTIEVQEFHRIAGENQMPMVHRIERAAVESQALLHGWSD